MFNITVLSHDYNKLKAELKQKGLTVCLEQTWYDNGVRWLDVSVQSANGRYSRTLAESLYSRYSY